MGMSLYRYPGTQVLCHNNRYIIPQPRFHFTALLAVPQEVACCWEGPQEAECLALLASAQVELLLLV